MRIERIPEPPLDPPAPLLRHYCEDCGADIYAGDTFYNIHDSILCEHCVNRSRRYAGVSEDWYE